MPGRRVVLVLREPGDAVRVVPGGQDDQRHQHPDQHQHHQRDAVGGEREVDAPARNPRVGLTQLQALAAHLERDPGGDGQRQHPERPAERHSLGQLRPPAGQHRDHPGTSQGRQRQTDRYGNSCQPSSLEHEEGGHDQHRTGKMEVAYERRSRSEAVGSGRATPTAAASPLTRPSIPGCRRTPARGSATGRAEQRLLIASVQVGAGGLTRAPAGWAGRCRYGTGPGPSPPTATTAMVASSPGWDSPLADPVAEQRREPPTTAAMSRPPTVHREQDQRHPHHRRRLVRVLALSTGGPWKVSTNIRVM